MRDSIRMYKNTMREDAMEFGDPYVRAQTQQKLKIAEHVAVYNACDIDKAARIDDRSEHCRKCKSYHRSVRKYHASSSKAISSKVNSSS